MSASEYPIHQSNYKGYAITVFAWGDDEQFYAEFDDGFNHAGAAAGHFDTVDDALAACKKIIDDPYGTSP